MPSTRTKSTRSSARSSASTAKATASKSSSRRSTATTTTKASAPASKKGKAKASSSNVIYKDDTESSEESSSDDDLSGDAYGEGSAAEDEDVAEEEADEDLTDSDDFDGESSDYDYLRQMSKKRKSTGSASKRSQPSSKKAKVNGKQDKNGKAGKSKPNDDVEYSDYTDDDDDDDVVLEEGQEIAGRIYPAPVGGKVPAGQISRNTFKFLVNLQTPERNDRDWFKSHDPAFRIAEKEWVAFVQNLVPRMCETDNELSPWPPKDLIHRIYRDVRFSNDKTPYKRNFSVSLSRSGRKGIWAGYFLSISPRGHSMFAAGVWAPGKNEVASIRHAILTNPQQIRDVISEKEFVGLFGPAKPDGNGEGKRCNVYGHDDALKTAPKGMDKTHKDIDLLKLRSVAVVTSFDDKQVLSPDFMDTVINAVRIATPFVHCINNCIALPAPAPDAE